MRQNVSAERFLHLRVETRFRLADMRQNVSAERFLHLRVMGTLKVDTGHTYHEEGYGSFFENLAFLEELYGVTLNRQ
jgi:hypothetical protein